MRCGAGRFQRLDLQRIAIRFVEQLGQFAGKFIRQFEARQLFGIARLQRQLLTLLFGAGQRGLEHIGRRGAIAALAFLVEIDRRAVQAEQCRRRFQRTRRMAEILGGDLLERELIRRTAFPQKIHFDGCGGRFGLREKFGQGRLGEAQHHIGRLDLAALSGRALYLERGGVVGHDAADLESAVFFVKDVHGRMRGKLVRIIAARNIIPWHGNQQKTGLRRFLCAAETAAYFWLRIHVTMVLMSLSLTVFGVAGMGMGPKDPAQPLRVLPSSLAWAPLSSLYFAAISIRAGPTAFLATAWHAPQLLFLNKASPSSAAKAAAETDKAAITARQRVFMIFMAFSFG